MTPEEYNQKYQEIQNWYQGQQGNMRGTNSVATGEVGTQLGNEYRNKMNELTNAYRGGSNFQKTPTQQSQGYNMPNFSDLDAKFNSMLQAAVDRDKKIMESQGDLRNWFDTKAKTLGQAERAKINTGDLGQTLGDMYRTNQNALTDIYRRPGQTSTRGLGNIVASNFDMPQMPQQQMQMPQQQMQMPQQQMQMPQQQMMRQNPMMGGMGGYGMGGGMMNPYAMGMFGPMMGMNPMMGGMMGGYGMMNPMMGGMMRRRQRPQQQPPQTPTGV